MKSTIELKAAGNLIEYTVDWSKLPREAKFVAVDSDGVVCWYGSKPELGTNSWIFGCESYNFIEDFGVVICNWEDTLTPRPQPAKFEIGDLVRIKYDNKTYEVTCIYKSITNDGRPIYELNNSGIYPQDNLVKIVKKKVKKATSETVEYDESEIEIGSLWTPKDSTLFDGHVYMLVKTGDTFLTASLTMPGEVWAFGSDTKKGALPRMTPFHGEVKLKG